jgi:DNA-binding NarL/FixJ family response regulator
VTRSRLTRREADVLNLLAEGLTDRQIADRLVVEMSTVKFHRQNVFRKLGVHSRSAAGAVLWKARLASVNEDR